MNVLDATTAFKTVACLNVTLAHAKIGCAVPVNSRRRGLPPDLYDTNRRFCQVTGLASGLKVASLVADIVERLPDAAFDPAILSDNHKCPDQALA